MLIRALYNVVFVLLFVLSSPWYLRRMIRRGNWKVGFWQRFGCYSKAVRARLALEGKPVIWFHAVSVGEVNSCLRLMAALRPLLRDWAFVISTTTTTGMEVIRRRAEPEITAVYYPVDLPWSVNAALAAIKPRAIVIIEAEVWPNMIWAASRRGVRLILANARLSERSYRGYRALPWLFKPVFRSFCAVFAQAESDVPRLKTLGVPEERIHVVGNFKFDAVELDPVVPAELAGAIRGLGLPETVRVIFGGSTHAGEEAVLARIYLALKSRIPDLVLFLVPRHFERAETVAAELAGLGLRVVRRSALTRANTAPAQIDCLLVDTTGELKYLYRYATVVFVGKSLTAHGGQNPIEPAAAGKPVVFGPYMENFESIARALVEAGAAVQVRDQAELAQVIEQMILDPDRCRRMGEAARGVVVRHRGATDRAAALLAELLRGV